MRFLVPTLIALACLLPQAPAQDKKKTAAEPAKRVIHEMGDGSGCVMIDGKMQDDATYKQCQVMVNAAQRIARRDAEYAQACGFRPEDLTEA